MKLSIKHSYKFLFLLGVFFLPFNSYEGISFLGEYKRDAAIIFFLLSSFLFFIDSLYKGKIKFPQKSLFIQFLILFIGWIFISVIFNSVSIYQNYIKETSGFSRFIRQLISLFIALTLFITSYNIIISYSVKSMFLAIRRASLYSFGVVVFYGLIETLIVYFNVLQLKPFILLFDYLPFIDVYLDFKGVRISSVTYEPPFLAIYLITIAGWMFSYIITSKGMKKYIPTLLVFMLTFFSGSRTALIVVLVQFVIFIAVIFTVSVRLRKVINRLIILSSCLLIMLFIFNGKKISQAIETKIESLNFKENLTTNISNKSRLGIQYTSLLIFSENPIFGVGFGQQAYHARNRYPEWATTNNYEFKLFYLNDKIKSFPPGYNMYTRLLAETGIIGFGIFTTLLLLILYQSTISIKRRFYNEKTISIVLFVSFIGFIINWLQFDSFRMYGFWICLSLLIAQLNEKRIDE